MGNIKLLAVFFLALVVTISLGTLVYLKTTQSSSRLSALLNSTTCRQDLSGSSSLFKIFIFNNFDAPYFDGQKNQIINDLKTISPFKENFSKISIYSGVIPQDKKIDCSSSSSALSASGLVCNNDAVNTFIKNNCQIKDPSPYIKILITKSIFGGSGGDVIVIGSRPPDNGETIQQARDTTLALSTHVAIHEIGHNLGLGDLYGGNLTYSGDPSSSYPDQIATAFPNTDTAGCPKWCSSYKPVSAYSSQCPKITDEGTCRTINRDPSGSCANGDTCCIWSNTPLPYFGHCAPAVGQENIGLSCKSGTGCYFGASLGQNAWRPVKDTQSIMLHPKGANEFDPVSENWLAQAINYCLTDQPLVVNPQGEEKFLAQYKNLISVFAGFKQKTGRCGIEN